MGYAKLDNNLLAIEAGNITVYNFDSVTREYLSATEEFLAVGVGIPANSCIEAPGKNKAGFAICRMPDLTKWGYVADHRGEVVYSTETGNLMTITAPGDYPENTTTKSPATPYDKWNGSEWVTDTEAQHTAEVEEAEQHKAALLSEAQETTSLWQAELQLGIISDEDKASLITWVKYIKAIKAVDTSGAPDIIWPDKPKSDS